MLGLVVCLSGHCNTVFKQKLQIEHPSGHVLLHMMAPESTRFSVDVHFPSTISSNLHADEYESQSAILKLVTSFELGRSDCAKDGDNVGDNEVDGDGATEGISVSLHDLTASKQNIHIVHPSGHVLLHVMSPVSNKFAAELHFPSTIS